MTPSSGEGTNRSYTFQPTVNPIGNFDHANLAENREYTRSYEYQYVGLSIIYTNNTLKWLQTSLSAIKTKLKK